MAFNSMMLRFQYLTSCAVLATLTVEQLLNRSGVNMPNHNHEQAIRAARKTVADQETIVSLAEIFDVLGDQTRLKIVLALSKQELCVLDIAAVLGITESGVSHQMRLLKTLRLVKQRKEGKMVFYSLDDEHIEDLIRIAINHLAE
jgi:ArsR family transcriptional regulator, lead/cadmium/zinc/bismuth-responsive transcriptional repressor